LTLAAVENPPPQTTGEMARSLMKEAREELDGHSLATYAAEVGAVSAVLSPDQDWSLNQSIPSTHLAQHLAQQQSKYFLPSTSPSISAPSSDLAQHYIPQH
jgi:hypothetical protein